MSDGARLAAAPARAPVAMDYFVPAPDLASLVSGYHLFRCELPLMRDVTRAEMGQLRFLLSGGGSYRFGTGAPVRAPEVAIAGPTHAATRIEAHGPTVVLGIGLLPAGWAALVGQDAHALRDAVTDAAPLFGGAMLATLGRLRRATTVPHILSIADALVRHLSAEGEEPPFWFTEIVDAWLTDDASPDVDTLVAATGLSGRHVERLANRIYGAPPKLLARKFRALRAAARIAAGADWQALYEDAFYDQSHAIREIKHFIGMTPGQLIHSESPISRMSFQQRGRLENLPKLVRVS